MNPHSLNYTEIKTRKELTNNTKNNLFVYDHSIHDWYRFVLSYPPQLVRKYLTDFKVNISQKVLDPFCGTGTTNVECKLNNVTSVGVEQNPFPFFASKVKTNWQINDTKFLENSKVVARKAFAEIGNWGINDDEYTEFYSSELLTLPFPSEKLLINNSLSPLPKHKSIILFRCIQEYGEDEFKEHQKLAFSQGIGI